MNHSDNQVLERLTQSVVFRDYTTAFRGAVGLPLVLTLAGTPGSTLLTDAHESPFCQLLARHHAACARCLAATPAPDDNPDVSTDCCITGLRGSAVPVRTGHRLVGYLRTGHVFTHPPTEADFQQTVQALARRGALVRPEELRRAYFATRVVAPAQFQAILGLLTIFAIHLGAISNEIMETGAAGENPQITRAREFIAQNWAEDLRLADCARTAHMSPFYFCKMFKRTTGLSFTLYLSRLRTERAKARLQDAHVRVSEVAFAVGFQSLSQFNRVFKRETGQVPTDFRRELQTQAGTRGTSSPHSLTLTVSVG